MAENRNDAIHATYALLYGCEQKETMIAHDQYGNKRSARLAGKDLIEEFQSYQARHRKSYLCFPMIYLKCVFIPTALRCQRDLTFAVLGSSQALSMQIALPSDPTDSFRAFGLPLVPGEQPQAGLDDLALDPEPSPPSPRRGARVVNFDGGLGQTPFDVSEWFLRSAMTSLAAAWLRGLSAPIKPGHAGCPGRIEERLSSVRSLLIDNWRSVTNDPASE